MTQDERHKIVAETRARLRGHATSPRPSVSWHFNAVTDDLKYLFDYSFAVTWTPGTLVLSGDLGELTVTHWNAMSTMEHAVRWMLGASFGYIISKSDAKEVYDSAGTRADILRMANEEPLESLRSYHQELQQARREYNADLASAIAAEEPAPEFKDYLDSVRTDPRVVIYDHGSRAESRLDDCWATWRALYKFRWASNRGCETLMTREGRHVLLKSLDLDNTSEAADISRAMRWDDYYGSYEYPHEAVRAYAALQHWAEAASRGLQPVAVGVAFDQGW